MSEQSKLGADGLEVVGWHHSHAEVATSDKARVASWLTECVEPLCRLTDAQARLAQKDARIAQLAAHARGKNKALANALKEIERFDSDFKRLGEQYVQALHQITTLRAQLEQLQAAPAERGAVLPELLRVAIMRADDVLHALAGWESSSVKLEQRHGADWLKEIDAIRRELHTQLARLNPAPATAAPATADSDVREVKK